MHIQTSNFLACIKALLIWRAFWSVSFYCLFLTPYFFRFDNPTLNYSTFMLLELLVPISLIWLSKQISGFWRGLLIVIALASLIPIALITLLTFATSKIDENGKDLSFYKISELRGESNYYRLYRTNGGATTSFGLVLRREKPIFFGLKLVSPVKGFYPASKGSLEKLSSTTARLIVLPNGYGEGEQVYDFKFD